MILSLELATNLKNLCLLLMPPLLYDLLDCMAQVARLLSLQFGPATELFPVLGFIQGWLLFGHQVYGRNNIS